LKIVSDTIQAIFAFTNQAKFDCITKGELGMAAKRKTEKKSAPSKKVLSAKVALHRLGKIASAAIKSADIDEPTGRCRFTTSSGTHCAVLTKSWCVDELHGEWTEGADCP
jgi:hypothetical protein